MNIKSLKGDFFGGITAGVIALPLALAFGVSSGAGAMAGLYGAIVLGLVAALLGGTATQISGPTGPMSVIAASVIAYFSGDIQTIVFIFVLAGIFQAILGFSKVGKFVQYIPYPVISGFMSGVGIIIILLQINPLLGSDISGSTLHIIANLHQSFLNFNMQSFLLGAISLSILFLTPKKIGLIIPPTLIALFVATTISEVWHFDVAKIGEIPSTFPTIYMPDFDFVKLNVIIPYAFTLAVLGSIDSLLTSLVADSLTKSKHNSNKELIGQGIGNALAGFIGGLPGAGATMRTVINIKSGGNSRLSGVIHSLFLIVTVAGASSHVGNIPLAVLAGILIKVGVDILDYRLLKKIRKAPKYDLYVMITVLVLTVFIDLIVAVGVGIVLSSLLLIHRITRKIEVDIKDIDEESIKNQDKDIVCHTDHKIRIITIDGPFFFGSVSQIINRTIKRLNTKVIIFDFKSVPFMDVSAIFSIEDIIENLHEKGFKLVIIARGEGMYNRFMKMELGDLIGDENIFIDSKKAIIQSKKLLKEVEATQT
jgi:SulP family sulfate permease